jgi:hypothetical protein
VSRPRNRGSSKGSTPILRALSPSPIPSLRVPMPSRRRCTPHFNREDVARTQEQRMEFGSRGALEVGKALKKIFD